MALPLHFHLSMVAGRTLWTFWLLIFLLTSCGEQNQSGTNIPIDAGSLATIGGNPTGLSVSLFIDGEEILIDDQLVKIQADTVAKCSATTAEPLPADFQLTYHFDFIDRENNRTEFPGQELAIGALKLSNGKLFCVASIVGPDQSVINSESSLAAYIANSISDGEYLEAGDITPRKGF